MSTYTINKSAKTGEMIECPVCHTVFKKKQYSQAFCCSKCKDKYHNSHDGDRHLHKRDNSIKNKDEHCTESGIYRDPQQTKVDKEYKEWMHREWVDSHQKWNYICAYDDINDDDYGDKD